MPSTNRPSRGWSAARHLRRSERRDRTTWRVTARSDSARERWSTASTVSLASLDAGGWGWSFMRWTSGLERSVAIKFIRPELLDRGDLRERFLSEARAMARVRHPHVLPIYALGEHQGMPYFVTAFVEGQTVERWLASRAPGALPDLAVAQRILEDACRGRRCHSRGCDRHRDVKRAIFSWTHSFESSSPTWGSPIYSGEPAKSTASWSEPRSTWLQRSSCRSRSPGARAPLRRLLSGLPRFELFTGRAPYGGGTSGLARMMAHVIESAPKPSGIRPELPRALDDIVLRALAKDPRDRTPSADAFRRAVASAFQGSMSPRAFSSPTTMTTSASCSNPACAMNSRTLR